MVSRRILNMSGEKLPVQQEGIIDKAGIPWRYLTRSGGTNCWRRRDGAEMAIDRLLFPYSMYVHLEEVSVTVATHRNMIRQAGWAGPGRGRLPLFMSALGPPFLPDPRWRACGNKEKIEEGKEKTGEGWKISKGGIGNARRESIRYKTSEVTSMLIIFRWYPQTWFHALNCSFGRFHSGQTTAAPPTVLVLHIATWSIEQVEYSLASAESPVS